MRYPADNAVNTYKLEKRLGAEYITITYMYVYRYYLGGFIFSPHAY